MRRAHAKEISNAGAVKTAHDRGSRGAMEQAQCKSGVAYAPCVVREWSHRSGLRGFASAERPSSASGNCSHHAQHVRRVFNIVRTLKVNTKARGLTLRYLVLLPRWQTRIPFTSRHNAHNRLHGHHGKFRRWQQRLRYRSVTRASISTTTNAAARPPFWASLRVELRADNMNFSRLLIFPYLLYNSLQL